MSSADDNLQASTASKSSQALMSMLVTHFGHANFTIPRVSKWMKSDLQIKVRDLTLIPEDVKGAREECFAYHPVVSSAGQDARDKYYGSSRPSGERNAFEVDHALQSYFAPTSTQRSDDGHLKFAGTLLTDSLLKDKHGVSLVADAECLRLLQIKNEMTRRTADQSYDQWTKQLSEEVGGPVHSGHSGIFLRGNGRNSWTTEIFADWRRSNVIMEEDEGESGTGTHLGSGLGGADGVPPANGDPTILRQLRSLHLGHSDAQATDNNDEGDSAVTGARLHADGSDGWEDPDDQEFDDEGDEGGLGLARYSSRSG